MLFSLGPGGYGGNRPEISFPASDQGGAAGDAAELSRGAGGKPLPALPGQGRGPAAAAAGPE